MKRLANIMYVKEGFYEEYKRRHDNIWPEMTRLLKHSGVSDYSIFLNKDNGELFAVLHYEDRETYEKMADNPICRKWWDYMADIMLVNNDNSPKSIELNEVFYLE